MAPTGVQIFGSPTTAEVARVLTCLFEKDVEFQLIRVDNFKGIERKPDYLTPGYLKLQAITFEDGKKTLVDSREICRYICEKYRDQGNKDLFGSGNLERATIEQWLQTEEDSFDPLASELVLQLAYEVTAEENTIKAHMDDLSRVLDTYEERLSAKPFLAGDKFSLADLSHLPNAHTLVAATRTKQLFTSRKNVNNWLTRISDRQSWRKAVEMKRLPLPLLEEEDRAKPTVAGNEKR